MMAAWIFRLCTIAWCLVGHFSQMVVMIIYTSLVAKKALTFRLHMQCRTDCNLAPLAKLKMATRGLQNGWPDLEKGLIIDH